MNTKMPRFEKRSCRLSCCEDIYLLLRKNFLIQYRHPIQSLIELLLPCALIFIIVLFRMRIDVQKHPEGRNFTAINLNSIEQSKIEQFAILYTPDNALHDAIVNHTVSRMNIPWGPKLNVFKFNSTSSMIHFYKNEFRESQHGKIFAGIDFINLTTEYFEYKLRFSGVPHHYEKSPLRMSWETTHIMPELSPPGPRTKENDGGSPGYQREGFLLLQHHLTMSMAKYILGDIPELEEETEGRVEFLVRQFPFPPYLMDVYLFALSIIFPGIIVFSFIYPAVNLSKSLVMEKEKRLKESMKMMGLSEKYHWIAYWIKAFVWAIPSNLCMVILLTIQFKRELAILNFSSPTLIFLFFTVYEIQIIAFCFAISSFFSKANLAGIVTGTMFFFTFAPFGTAIQHYGNMNPYYKLMHCLLPNTNMAFGIYIITMKESRGIGARWNNLFESGVPADILSLGGIMGIQLLNSLIYLLITWYMNEAFPGEYGVPKAWYFPFTKSYWKGFESDRIALLSHRSSYELDSIVGGETHMPKANTVESNFEIEPKNLRTLIEIKNLCKTYDSGRTYSVKDLSLNMYEHQITALLGHNGAGKTTTISILTGLFPASSGAARIDNYDIRSDMQAARTSMGICPQFNVLFDELTVEEHFEFYCKLKKTPMSEAEIKEEINDMIKKLDLCDKRNTLAANLSGGMQRKLSVGIALIGKSRVVFLDEPTSGMDVSARRFIWDLLLREKQNRCILITTHFMEEADVLGDRIGIMSNGELCCCGSPLFLKKRFGTGYHLTIAKENPNVSSLALSEFIKDRIPESALESSVGTEVTFSLPETQSSKFPELLKCLEDDSSLQVESYAISVTTMEEVFLKVGEYAKNGVENFKDSPHLLSKSKGSVSLVKGSVDPHSNRRKSNEIFKNHGIFLFFQQLYALLVKKWLYIIRSPVLTGCQIFIPFLILNLILFIMKSIDREADSTPITNTIEQFDKPLIKYYFDQSSEDFGQYYNSSLQQTSQEFHVSTIGIPKSDEISVWRDVVSTDLGIYNYRFMISAVFYRINGKLFIESLFNNQAFHTPSIALKYSDEAYLRYIYKMNSSQKFLTKLVNHPLPLRSAERLKTSFLVESTQFQVMQGLTTAVAVLVSTFTILIVKERVSKGKHLQMLTGVQKLVYWASYFFMDFIIYLISAAFMISAFVFYKESNLDQGQQPLRLLLLFSVNTFAILPFVYATSFLFSSSASACAKLCLYIIIFGLGSSLVDDLTALPAFDLKAMNEALIPYLLFTNPIYDLTKGVTNLIKNHQHLQICANGIYEHYCYMNITDTQYSELIPCCRNLCKDNCFDYQTNYLSFEQPAIGGVLLSTFFCGLLYWIILIFIEFQIFQMIYNWFSKFYYYLGVKQQVIEQRRIERKVPIEDSDVSKEKNRINAINLPDEGQQHPLIVRNLVKRFGTFTAVDNISYAVRKGECFGMLGVNGAGKTTTFKIITGDEPLTSGDIYVNGKNLSSNIREIQRQIGYCPQFDALLEDMTGRECMVMYSRLRGIREADIPEQINSLARTLYFEMHLDKKIGAYSGGNKRKLSTALALIGDPCISFLDEPTTGVDPVARRCLWEALSSKLRDGLSMVLTSHSMEECEALCQRLVIMVNGQICCVGSPLQLKNKFGNGYTVLIRVAQDQHPQSMDFSSALNKTNGRYLEVSMDLLKRNDSSCQRSHNARIIRRYIKRVKRFMSETFPTSILKAVHNTLLHYCIEDPHKTIKCSEIFAQLEMSKERLRIEDYTVCQTNLEQIFLTFARMQQNETDSPAKKTAASTERRNSDSSKGSVSSSKESV